MENNQRSGGASWALFLGYATLVYIMHLQHIYTKPVKGELRDLSTLEMCITYYLCESEGLSAIFIYLAGQHQLTRGMYRYLLEPSN